MKDPSKKISPPKLADQFLNWFCKKELVEEIEGDLFELYKDQLELRGWFRANLVYWYHVFHFLRPFALRGKRKQANSIIMYRSYLKTGIRNLKRQRLASFINVFGLATTIAISVVVYVLLERQFTLDQFHQEADRIYAIQSDIDWNGRDETWGKTPLLLGQVLLDEVPQIEEMTRVKVTSGIVRFDDKVFNERITFADPEYLSLFSFPLMYGESSALVSKSSVIISERLALKYFDDQEVVGEEVKLIIDGVSHLFQVAGVAHDFPDNASFSFDFLVNLDNLENIYGTKLAQWDDVRNESVFTFIELDGSANLNVLESSLDKHKAVSNEINQDWPIQKFRLEPLTSLARNAQFISEPYASGSTPQILMMFAIISALLLISACFNYINISVSMTQKRLNEIAVRKVVGGQRKQLVAQFMTENFLLCLIATIVGAVIGTYLFLPGVNAIFSGSNYAVNLLQDPYIMVFLFGLFLILGLVSGAYPALYISAFKPVDILKGKRQKAGNNRLSRFFLTIQFFLTFVAIVSGLLFTSINEFQSEKDWGYNQENILVVPVDNQEQADEMLKLAAQSPRILGSAGSQSQIGLSQNQGVVKLLDERMTVRSFTVGAGYLETLGVRLVTGRTFNKAFSTDVQHVIVNENFLKKSGMDPSAIEMTSIELDGENVTIIGVVEDFRFDDFFTPMTPALFRLNDNGYNYISFKTVSGGLTTTEQVVMNDWANLFPDSPYNGFFQEEVFDGFFESTGALNQIMQFVAFVAIVLSAMGLFGLASLMVMKKIKEYSIRKVLGAKGGHIVNLISKQFLILMGMALVLGIPLSYFLFDFMFEQIFPDSLDGLSSVPFLMAIILLGGVIFLTISSHIIQLLRMNPVKNLRLE